MERLKIAIIDSGIEDVKNYEGVAVYYDNIKQEYGICDNFYDKNGHGTIVTNIIKSQISDVDFFILKIFDEEDEVETDKLIFALKFLHDNIHPDIVHLSMGVTFCENISALEQICSDMVNANTVIVAAFDNNGAVSFPAAFTSVVGVESTKQIYKSKDYYYISNSPINILAIGTAQRLLGKDNKYYDVVGTSFSAPYITSAIAKIMASKQCKMSKQEVLKYLKSQSKKTIDSENVRCVEGPFEIKKGIIFPYNKEINTLLRHSESHIFHINGIYDVKFLKNLGKIIIVRNKKIKIESFEKIDWEADFDTFILGHIKEMESISGRNYTEHIIDKCIQYKKNLYSFDELTNAQLETLKKANIKVFTPRRVKKNTPICYNGRLRQIGKPIVCIAGTSNKQGKFSLQLQLKSLLEKQIKIGFLSTEPSGYLVGADAVFPMGYNSTINFDDGNNYISTVNCVLGQIEDKSIDLIITGLQSQTIPTQVCNLRDMVLYNHYFLLGVNPDAVILVVNVFDEIETIERTISYLESIIVCDVISIVVFPVMRNFKWNTLGDLSYRYSDDEINHFKNKLTKHFNKKVFVLDDNKDIKNLSKICLKYFLR